MTPQPPTPIIIIGAGISGLLLAHHLTTHHIPYTLYERRPNLATQNEGWGLTLHWSLPTLRHLLGASLSQRLPETYVNRAAVDRGAASTFPFYDLSTGEEKGRTPFADESQRVRVGRQGVRRLVGEGVRVEWGKTYVSHTADAEGVTVTFDDGTQCTGSLLLGCDGANSRVRRTLHPGAWGNSEIPIKVMGVRAEFTYEQVKPLLEMDPFFLQATSSVNDTYMYFSVLSPPTPTSPFYTTQLVISWPHRPNFFSHPSPLDIPSSNPDRHALLQSFSSTWADPFRSLIRSLPPDIEIKPIHLSDWIPRKSPAHLHNRVALLGDAFHPMAMYRGDGANHAIRDVWDLVRGLGIGQGMESGFSGSEAWDEGVGTESWGEGSWSEAELRKFLENYEEGVIRRTEPAVKASRRAALDAHSFGRITEGSPLVSRRVMMVEYREEEEQGEGKGEV